MGLVVPLLLGLGVLLTLSLSRRPLRSKAWVLLRSLLPSWRFFEDVEPGPELLCRVALPGGEYGAWQGVLQARAASRGLVLNAAGNLQLAYQSLVEQLESELDGVERGVAPTLVPYRLVQRLVEQRLRSSGNGVGTRYQFCIGDAGEGYVSEEHAL
ncbi:MAG TPA: hypothetical protein VHB79_37625 [Polyangiaceae bacterium]|nr:hypothetical protein [Polyangiaceae bacterium]